MSQCIFEFGQCSQWGYGELWNLRRQTVFFDLDMYMYTCMPAYIYTICICVAYHGNVCETRESTAFFALFILAAFIDHERRTKRTQPFNGAVADVITENFAPLHSAVVFP